MHTVHPCLFLLFIFLLFSLWNVLITRLSVKAEGFQVRDFSYGAFSFQRLKICFISAPSGVEGTLIFLFVCSCLFFMVTEPRFFRTPLYFCDKTRCLRNQVEITTLSFIILLASSVQVGKLCGNVCQMFRIACLAQQQCCMDLEQFGWSPLVHVLWSSFLAQFFVLLNGFLLHYMQPKKEISFFFQLKITLFHHWNISLPTLLHAT